MKLQFFNTLTRKKEEFTPIEPNKVRFYACGPTVYAFAHIGNLRTYIFEDLLRRLLEKSGLQVSHVMNITDVGHLESDADEGDDKMSLAAKKEQKNPWDIARFYEEAFFADCAHLNIMRPTTVCRATEHIQEMQEQVKTLLANDHAYVANGNVYYRIAKFPSYTALSRRNLEQLQEGARVEVDANKENPLDFVLWFSQSKFPNQIMQWDSPWGKGFPGWHIECSAMASKYLGERIDIHTGGIDHISVHHTNEIAQAEGCFGHKWVNVWMHGEFLVLVKEKMAKSSGNFLTLKSLSDLGFEPLHFRYLCLGAHYRSQLVFSDDALASAKNSFENLKNRVISWKLSSLKKNSSERVAYFQQAFWAAMADDLNTPVAMGVVWEMAKDNDVGDNEKLQLIEDFDAALGLNVRDFSKPELAPEMMDLVKEREIARVAKDFALSDKIRDTLKASGIMIKDTKEGAEWYVAFKD